MGRPLRLVSPKHVTCTANRGPAVLLSEQRPARRFLMLALLLTLAAIAWDQYAAPVLHSSSPLWATAALLLLSWRRGGVSSSSESASSLTLSIWRIGAFLAAHVAIIAAARAASVGLQTIAGTASLGGTLLALLKLGVLVPTLLLLPLAAWRQVAKEFPAELIAASVVLFTYFPRRVLESLWPWYSQVLGRFVFCIAGPLVTGLGYAKALNPTLTGRELDVTILPACSGINGVELFQMLFALLIFCDWNRLGKGRALLSYFSGLGFMLLGNTLRITSFVVLGNHGLSGWISRFHISAGWIFFSLVFLVYLAFFYHWMLAKGKLPGSAAHSNEETAYSRIFRHPEAQTGVSRT